MSDTPADGSMFIERIRERFTRTHDGVPGEDMPHRRGLAITMCVLIAIILWFTLSLRKTYTDQIAMPTQVVRLADDMALAQEPPSTVQAQVRGEGIELFRLRFNPPTLLIDAQQDLISLEDLVYDLPKGVVLESVTPREFNLVKERRVSRLIPIKLVADIETTETEDLLHDPVLDPDSIVVSGARSVINDLKYWPTKPVVIKSLSDSLVARIELSDSLAGLINRSHITTMLTVVARPFTSGERQLKVQVTGLPSNQRIVSLDPSIIRVTFRVPLAQYEQAIQAPDFFATVSYDEIRADTSGRVTPRLEYPPDLVLRQVELSPSSLRYYERLVGQ